MFPQCSIAISRVMRQTQSEVVMAARRSALLIAPLAIALLAALSPATSAAASSYSTKVIVSLKFPAFHGKLRSGKGVCATSRTVKLFRKRKGPDKLLGTDRSNAKTRWAIPIGRRLTSGSYYVKAPAKGRCKPAKSKMLTIP
jgi:hypothetical protein